MRGAAPLAALLAAACAPGSSAPPRVDVWIRGGTVLDGSGAAGERADVFVVGDRVVFVGLPERPPEAELRLDATGLVVAPGFVDTHAHGDPFATPAFENALAQGVTTICLGQDGSSPGADDPAAWMAGVEALPPGPNVALFAGHGTLRHQVGLGFEAAPSAAQLDRLEVAVERALRAGCFGLTTGLEYRPGSLAGPEELEAIARPVGAAGALVMSHVRSEDDAAIDAALEELFTQGARAGAAVHVSHLKVVHGRGAARADALLARIEQARARGVRVTADLYPYDASYTGIAILFPDWALPPADYASVLAERGDELATHLRERVLGRNGPEATLFGTGALRGRTLAEAAAERGVPFEDLLVELGPEGASAAYFVMDRELRERLLSDPRTMICSDGSPTMHHPRGYGSFAKVLRESVRERAVLSLEEAVHRMTGLPARTLGLDAQGRGLLREGWIADLVVFDPDAVRDRASFEEPHALAEGVSFVLVGGRLAWSEGAPAAERGGRMLRRAP